MNSFTKENRCCSVSLSTCAVSLSEKHCTALRKLTFRDVHGNMDGRMALSLSPADGAVANCRNILTGNCEIFSDPSHPTSGDSEAPLNKKLIQFVQAIRRNIGRCAVSGSAALAELLHQMNLSGTSSETQQLWKLSENNDVDLFVPLNPNLQKQAEGQDTSDDERLATFHELFESRIVPQFPTHVCERQHPCDFKTMDSEAFRACKCSFLSLSPGMNDILQADMRDGKPKVQIVVLAKTVAIEEGSWDDVIPQDFDINVVKLRVDFPHLHNPWQPEVSFVDVTAEDCLKNGCFDYVVRPAQKHSRCADRMHKHIERGFTVRSLSFDRRVCRLGTADWCNDARSDMCLPFLQQMMTKCQKEHPCRFTQRKRTRTGTLSFVKSEPASVAFFAEENRLCQECRLEDHMWHVANKAETISMLVEKFLPRAGIQTKQAITRLQVFHERDRHSEEPSDASHWEKAASSYPALPPSSEDDDDRGCEGPNRTVSPISGL